MLFMYEKKAISTPCRAMVSCPAFVLLIVVEFSNKVVDDSDVACPFSVDHIAFADDDLVD